MYAAVNDDIADALMKKYLKWGEYINKLYDMKIHMQTLWNGNAWRIAGPLLKWIDFNPGMDE